MDREFPNREPWEFVVGAQEELGELARWLIRAHRNKEHSDLPGKDAVGDVVIYLMGLCTDMGWSFEECVVNAWAEVRQRTPSDGEEKE